MCICRGENKRKLMFKRTVGDPWGPILKKGGSGGVREVKKIMLNIWGPLILLCAPGAPGAILINPWAPRAPLKNTFQK